MRRPSIHTLQTMKDEKDKITVLTLYDASFANLASECGVDILFVGDSLGMVVHGDDNTIAVQNEDVAYHTHCVARGNQRSIIMADLPFLTYHNSFDAIEHARVLMQAGAEIVKIEGGAWLAETVSFLTERGVPVCAHIGLTPQFVHVLGGFKIQGRNEQQAEELLQAAILLEQAGAKLIVLECIPHKLATEITNKLSIPTIGIGAGPNCDGQVLVLYDILGVTPGKPKKFVKNFMEHQTKGVKGAIENFVTEVKQNKFPTLEQSFE